MVVVDGRRTRRWTLALVLAASAGAMWVVGLAAFFFGMAYYGDDTPDQVWQFKVGLSLGLVGLVFAALLSIAAALASRLER
jgi:drug/metabolite transporter (DMT)-like permease